MYCYNGTVNAYSLKYCNYKDRDKPSIVVLHNITWNNNTLKDNLPNNNTSTKYVRKAAREIPKNATGTSAIYRFCFKKFMREMLRSLSKKVVNYTK